MEWLNLQTSVLHAETFIGSDPRARATWLAVSLWCAQQENGGRIVGARNWKTRRWQQTCGVTAREVSMAGRLLAYEGDDVLVWNYPADKEAEVRAKRKAGKDTAAKRWAERGSSADSSATSSADTEGKGKEEEGKGTDSSEPVPAPSESDPVVMTFPVVGQPGGEWPLLQSKIDEYRAAFPGASVDSELKLARQWCVDNPTRRKTAKGMTRFLFTWLERKQNRGGKQGDGPSMFSGAF